MKPLVAIFIGILLIISGCKKFVEIAPPETLTVTAKVYDNSATATSALTNIYAQMVQSKSNNLWPYFFPLYIGLYGDELTSYATTASIQQIYQGDLNAAGAGTNAIWSDGYNLIYQANAVIEGLQNSKSISPAIKRQLTAEAKFIRAYWHFYLTNFYGDIPIVTGTDYTVNEKAVRSPQAEVYQQIISDLQDAAGHLNPNYVSAADTTTTSDRFRPNAYAADALLARVFLYNKEYDSAEFEATKVISQTALYDTVPLNSVFLINNKEAIWQLMMPSSIAQTNNTFEGLDFVLNGAPLTNAFNSSTIGTQLMAAFEPGDLRKTGWIGSYTDNTVTPAKTYYFPYKYRQRGTTSTPQEYSVVLRLAEQYLIRAEARTELGDYTGAQADLNIIRHRAGLPNTIASDKTSLLAAILHERQVELFCEYGHRWLDLKRTGNVNTVMQQVAPQKGGTWSSDKALWPIPQTEIANDPNLTQNPGYEGGGTGS
ncbi:MAG: RagB/SusD family nutrient uptake outer membrane protein [Chitinophagaceae bacterium]|nr:MAG: RagB/SusD family nutrient uptake outer membrane protein [Chitinophagaceae bacterium]